MSFLSAFWGMLHHIDAHILALVAHYEQWSYLLLSAVAFLENGVILTPFLPGDSLIFVCGSLAAKGSLNVWLLGVLLAFFSALGALFNYAIGYLAKPYLETGKLSFIRPSYLQKTGHYFEKYGELTVCIAKFLPIVRTFAPFLAGVSRMQLVPFLVYNVLGSVLWTLCFVGSGYYFGNIPWIKDNLIVIAFVIVLLSVLPVGVRLLRGIGDR